MDVSRFQEVLKLIGDVNDQIVGDYFEARGLEPRKLDDGDEANPPSNCDWMVKDDDVFFLCEVKTVNSVQRGVETQAEFRKGFENRIRDYLHRKKSTRNLPYHLHFHSDSLTVPDDESLYGYLKLLSRTLANLHDQDDEQLYCMFSGCCAGAFDLAVAGSSRGTLEVQVSTYAGLNLRAVEGRVKDAIGQLHRSGEDYPDFARVIVLAFASKIYISPIDEKVAVFSDLAFKEKELWSYIDSVLKRNNDLSAIAVMRGQNPPRFSVYHNPDAVHPLSRSVFADGGCCQFDSLEAIPRAKVRPFNLQEVVSRMLQSVSEAGEPITLADYEALRSGQRE